MTALDSKLLDEWLDFLRRENWTFYYFPNRQEPEMVAAVKWWNLAVDVFVLLDQTEGVSYRAPMQRDKDPFDPLVITWYFQGDPVWAVRGIASYPGPGMKGERPWAQQPPDICKRVADMATKARGIRPPQR